MHEYFCKPICTEELPFEDILKQECIKNCPIKDYKEKNCILNYEPKEIGNNIKNEQDEYETDTKAEDLKLQNFEIGFTSPDYDPTELREKDEIFEDEKMKIILSTTQNQKNNTNENITLIDLGECEILLRKKNNISDDEILYMKNIEVNQIGMKIPKVDYDVYYKPGNSLVKLNLSVCKKSKITLLVPVSLTEDIDKLNSSSGYYNDICYTEVSEKGTYISLNDRKKQFIEKNKTVCQDNCIFSEYDYKKKKAKCSCDVKDSSILSFSNITINKTKLYNNFINIKNIANIKILVCYKELLNIKGIKYNIGCYLIIPILLLHIINIIIFIKIK